MKTRLLLVAAAWLLWAGSAQAAEPSGADRLERAIYLEETVGDLAQAVDLYRQITSDEKTPDAVRAQAQQRLASSLKKQGQAAPVPNQLVQVEKKQETPPAVKEKEDPSAGAALQEALAVIENTYPFPIDQKRLMEETLQALFQGLDGESDYLTAEQFQELSKTFEQQLVGIGVQIRFQEGKVEVATPIPGSPSEKAGVLPGDLILAVAETNLADLPEEQRLEAAVKLIRGKEGEPVILKIQRPGAEEAKRLTIRRAQIQLESVRGDTRGENGEWDYLLDDENKIAYLRILQFGNRTAAEVRAAVEKAKAQGAKALVLDLRNNPGGLLTEGAEVCDLFISGGKIVTVRSKGDHEQTIEANDEGTIDDLPLAVLVNRVTASSAEIVASCLQDHGRAAIVGEKTFGRGIVQSIVPLKATGGAVRITTGVYVRPNGTTIYRPKNEGQEAERGGVLPDEGLEVAWSEEQLQQYQEDRHQRDIRPAAEDAPRFEDTQLAKALAYLREKIAP